jgi:hypothetical protein
MCKPGIDRESYLENPRGKQNRVPAMQSNTQADSTCFVLLAAELDAFFPSLPLQATSTRTNLVKILLYLQAVSVLHLLSLSTVAYYKGVHKQHLRAAADSSSASHNEPHLGLSFYC